LIPTGERSGLPTRIASIRQRFVVRADEKLTAFIELESAIRAARLVSSSMQGRILHTNQESDDTYRLA
jgi:hypothetical protein